MKRLVLVGGVAIALITPAPGIADPIGIIDLPGAAIHGTATDLVGRPIEVCVYATSAFNGEGVAKGLTDADTGAYELSVPRGHYDVAAANPFEVTPQQPDPCRDPFWGQHSNEGHFVSEGPRRVSTSDDEPVDFALAYYLGGGAWGARCCRGTAVQPGESLDLLAWTSRQLRDGVVVTWRDTSTGSEVNLPFDRPMWIPRYDRYGCERSDSECEASPDTTFTPPPVDGMYPYELWAETLDGHRLSKIMSYRYWVDSVDPTLPTTRPADGAEVAAGSVLLGAEPEDAASGVSSVEAVVRDLADPDNPILDERLSSTSDGLWYAWLEDLPAHHQFEVTFTVSDNAANTTTSTITFTTGEPPPPPCADFLCEVGRIVDHVAGLLH